MNRKIRMLIQVSLPAMLMAGTAHAQSATTMPPSGATPPPVQTAPPSGTEAQDAAVAAQQDSAAQGGSASNGQGDAAGQDGATGQDIVVTGLRSTLNKASEIKRNSA